MKFLLLVTVVLLVNFGFAQNKTKHITEFSQKDTKDVMLIDVRTPEEFQGGHIENALNMNWFDPDFESRFKKYRRTQQFICIAKKEAEVPRRNKNYCL